jgi:GTPase SAR1 family protein
VDEIAAGPLKNYWKEQAKEFCMKIIVLTGQENVGKTTVLNLVYDDLTDSTK